MVAGLPEKAASGSTVERQWAIEILLTAAPRAEVVVESVREPGFSDEPPMTNAEKCARTTAKRRAEKIAKGELSDKPPLAPRKPPKTA